MKVSSCTSSQPGGDRVSQRDGPERGTGGWGQVASEVALRERAGVSRNCWRRCGEWLGRRKCPGEDAPWLVPALVWTPVVRDVGCGPGWGAALPASRWSPG